MEKKQHYKSMCRMCNNHCGINVYVENGRVVNITGLKEHRWNHGRLCVKGRLGVDLVNAPDRLKKPLKRVGSQWQEIDLEQAYDEIAEKIKKIQQTWGNRAMGIWKGEAVGFLTQEELARRFAHAIGSPNYFSNDSQCYVGRWIGYALVSGTWAEPDFANAKCTVIWGSNPPYAHPNMTQSILQGRENGGRLIVIDVRLSAMARQADDFIQILPGTDGALALGLARQLIRDDLISHEFIKGYTHGFDAYADHAKAFTPERVEKETGIPAERVVDIARKIGNARPKVCIYAGNGLEHHENGINNVRAIACLDGLLGSLDEEGGNFIPEKIPLRSLTLYDEKPLRHLGPIGADKFPVLYDFRQECHTMSAMDTILTQKPYPLKGMVLTGANPALTNPNSRKVIQALKALDLFVVRELFMTETAELAHYVLPAATYLEHSELHTYPVCQSIGISPEIVTFPECDYDYMFWKKLAHRLGASHYFPWEDENELNQWILKDTGITVETLFDHPEGFKYKSRHFQKYKKEKFNTPSGKFEFVSDYLKGHGYSHVPEYIAPTYMSDPNPEYPYVLVTGARKLFYCHGRNRNFKRCRTAIPHGEIEMHPHDARQLGVDTGDVVTVTSSVGSVDIPVTVVPHSHILPGVTQITHGWKESNVNLITHDDRNDPIDGFPLMKSVEVKIKPKRQEDGE
ncbi:Anaerobic selenocysteine-containing dehydrogenase [Desulfocicer vacuolatum DSM 3385]|uniref:Anaerobic selenocysteine-containing dehydrogenase n=1 Tax=Desulfocicer vacuolatum DSM 3385 TaxID=1121400 RepID=A0A1W2EIG9_9BACT|nr:molybdopterin-dependent oxidoreductase [Desulfocicer vacuolatum]SMD09484.1 Anaerobic selenocysteine-containing dehydrogenase [Desulfocicer vacuolatum DSM 3385]